MSKPKSATEVFPTRLIAARDKAKWTQVALAQAAGVTDRTIRRYEAGVQNPSLQTLDSLAFALGIDPINRRGADWFRLRRAPSR